MRQTTITLLFSFLTITLIFGQSTTIVPGGTDFDNKEELETITFPKLSTKQIMAISAPKAGMVVYDTIIKCIRQFDGFNWNCLTPTNDNGEIHCGGCSSTRVNYSRNIYGTDITADSVGVYMVHTAFDFIDITELLGNIYITQFDSAGNVMNTIYAISTIADPLLRSRRIHVTNDAIYTLYSFCGVLTQVNGPNINPVGDKADGLLLKHTKDGEFRWLKAFGGDNDDIPLDLTFDTNENIFVTGTTNSSVFNFGSLSFNNAGDNSFIAKIDSSGNEILLKKIEGSGDINPVEIEYSPISNNLLLLGNFDSSISFTGVDSIGIGSKSSFLLELDTLFNETFIEIIDSQTSNDSIKAIGFTYNESYNKIQFAFRKSPSNSYFPNTMKSPIIVLTTDQLFPLQPYNTLPIKTNPNSSFYYKDRVCFINTYADINVGSKSFRNNKFKGGFIISLDQNSTLNWVKTQGNEGVSSSAATSFKNNVHTAFQGFSNIGLCETQFNPIVIQDVMTFEDYTAESLFYLGLLNQ